MPSHFWAFIGLLNLGLLGLLGTILDGWIGWGLTGVAMAGVVAYIDWLEGEPDRRAKNLSSKSNSSADSLRPRM